MKKFEDIYKMTLVQSFRKLVLNSHTHKIHLNKYTQTLIDSPLGVGMKNGPK